MDFEIDRPPAVVSVAGDLLITMIKETVKFNVYINEFQKKKEKCDTGSYLSLI